MNRFEAINGKEVRWSNVVVGGRLGLGQYAPCRSLDLFVRPPEAASGPPTNPEQLTLKKGARRREPPTAVHEGHCGGAVS